MKTPDEYVQEMRVSNSKDNVVPFTKAQELHRRQRIEKARKRRAEALERINKKAKDLNW